MQVDESWWQLGRWLPVFPLGTLTHTPSSKTTKNNAIGTKEDHIDLPDALPSSHPSPLLLYRTRSSLRLPRFEIAIDHHITAHRIGSTTSRELYSSLPTMPPPLSHFGRPPPARIKVGVTSPTYSYAKVAIQVPDSGDSFSIALELPESRGVMQTNHVL